MLHTDEAMMTALKTKYHISSIRRRGYPFTVHFSAATTRGWRLFRWEAGR